MVWVLKFTHNPILGSPFPTDTLCVEILPTAIILLGFYATEPGVRGDLGDPRWSPPHNLQPTPPLGWRGKTFRWNLVTTGLALPLTSTNDPGILVVAAVVLSPAQVEAVSQASLAATAAHIIQQHGPAAIAEGAEDGGGESCAAAQLPTHYLGVGEVPVIVADGAPGAKVLHLHPPTAAPIAIGQPHATTCVEGPSTGTQLLG